MKWWALFLVFYVLVLSGLPCEAFCQEETPTAQPQKSRSDAGEQAHDEICSPFCLCASCPGFTIPQAASLTAADQREAPVLVAGLPAYQPPHAFDVPGRIWQPPRFS